LYTLYFKVFIALPGEDYAPAKDKINAVTARPQTLIKSHTLLLQLDQSLIPDDPRFARLQLEGSLPLLDLDISEHRLIELLKLLGTLPFPQGGEAPSSTNPPLLSTVSVSNKLIFMHVQLSLSAAIVCFILYFFRLLKIHRSMNLTQFQKLPTETQEQQKKNMM